MKILRWLNFSNVCLGFSNNGASRIDGVISYCTQSTILYSLPEEETLYRRISPAGDPRVSIVPVLDRWIEEGRAVRIHELKTMIRVLRSYRRFNHALQLCDWMSDRKYIELTAVDAAVRLDLICRVHGLEQAQIYFYNIPDHLKNFKVYGALLNCYAYGRTLDKAEGIMQNMKELGFMTTLSYNVMLNFYAKMGKYEKLDALIQEMQEMNINCDKATFYIQMNAYSVASDTEGMEKLLARMEANPLIVMDWHAYVTIANGYSNAGLPDKSHHMLKKAEKLIRESESRFAYEILLTSYANAGKKDEVYRLWNLSKIKGKPLNNGYFRMISSLVRLGDIDGAQEIFEEWDSTTTSFDFRILNLLINAYCRKGHVEKAEAIVKRAMEEGKEPPTSTWDCLATGHHKRKQMAKAVDTMKKAILADRHGWLLNQVTLRACVKYLRKKRDVKVAEEFMKLL